MNSPLLDKSLDFAPQIVFIHTHPLEHCTIALVNNIYSLLRKKESLSEQQPRETLVIIMRRIM